MSKRKALLLRIPEDLSAHLHRWAHDELRSVNAQIEYILREAVRRRTGRGAPAASPRPPGQSPPPP